VCTLAQVCTPAVLGLFLAAWEDNEMGHGRAMKAVRVPTEVLGWAEQFAKAFSGTDPEGWPEPLRVVAKRDGRVVAGAAIPLSTAKVVETALELGAKRLEDLKRGQVRSRRLIRTREIAGFLLYAIVRGYDSGQWLKDVVDEHGGPNHARQLAAKLLDEAVAPDMTVKLPSAKVVAEALSISPAAARARLQGKTAMSVSELVLLADALGVPVEPLARTLAGVGR